MSEWDQFPEMGSTAVADDWDQFPEVQTGEKSVATRSFYGLPSSSPQYPPTQERQGQDPNEIAPPDFLDAMMYGPGIPRPFEQQQGRGAQIMAGLGNAPSDIANFALSAPGALTMGIGELPAAVQRLVAAGFTVQQAKQALEAPTLQEGVTAGAGAALAGLGVIKAPSEMLRRAKPYVDQEFDTQASEVPYQGPAVTPDSPYLSGGLSEMQRYGPPAGYRPPESQRFQEPSMGAIPDESQSSSNIIRQAIEWRKGLMEEGAKLGEQAKIVQAMGQRVPKPLQDRINEINNELNRGYQPEPVQHYELRGDQQAFDVVRNEVPLTQKTPVQSEGRYSGQEQPVEALSNLEEQAAASLRDNQSETQAQPEIKGEAPIASTQNEGAGQKASPHDYVPALRTPTEYLVGDKGQIHQDIYNDHPDPTELRANEPEHGFWNVKTKEFKTRDETAKDLGVYVKGREFQSEELRALQEANPESVQATGQMESNPTSTKAADYQNRPISVDEEPRTTGISQRMQEPFGVQPGEGIGPEEATNLGRRDLEAGASPDAIAAKIDAGEAITGRETGVLRAHVENLAKESVRAQDAADIRPTDPNLRQAAQTAFERETAFRQRIKPAATEWQRVGATMQGETNIDTGSFTALRRAVVEQRGSDIRPHEAPKLRQAAEKVQRATRIEGIARDNLSKATESLKTKLPTDKDGLANHLANKFKAMLPCEL